MAGFFYCIEKPVAAGSGVILFQHRCHYSYPPEHKGGSLGISGIGKLLFEPAFVFYVVINVNRYALSR